MVEVGGVEPPSSYLNPEDATCLSCRLNLAVCISGKRDMQTASFLEFRSGPQKQKPRTIPRIRAASGLPGNRPDGLPHLSG